jgi:hypothetical protein
LPLTLRIGPGDALAGIGVLHHADFVPHEAAGVELVLKQPRPAPRVAIDSRGIPRPPARWRYAIAVQIVMNAERPDPQWRRITPHAFGNDGLRWHVRAYCHIDKKFKDFLLSRCLDTGSEGDRGAEPTDDRYWNEFFEVVLSPNPSLSEKQQEVIAQDYNMVGGRVSVPVRKALLYYFQKRLRLDVAGALDDLHEVPVVVANREAFTAALAEAMT